MIMKQPSLSEFDKDAEFYEYVYSLIAPHFPDGFVDFSVPKGWLPLVLELHNNLVVLHPDYRVAQVKEKYGSLRFYLEEMTVSGSFDEMFDAASELCAVYENLSCLFCQLCSFFGAEMVDVRGYVMTLCVKCLDSVQYPD